MKRLKGILLLAVIVLMTSVNQIEASSIVEGLEVVDIKLVLEDENGTKELDTQIYGNYTVLFFNTEDLKGIVETKEKYIEVRDLKKIEDISVSFTGDGYKIKKNTIKRDYDWYYNQKNTGVYSNVNCGPTVAVMAMKWLNKDFNISPKEAREEIMKEGGWWHVNDIIDFIENYGGGCIEKDYVGEEEPYRNQIIKAIDNGNIVISCVNVQYLGKRGTGHFLIILDYIEKDGELYFIVHDPDVGRNIEYRLYDMDRAIKNWSGCILIVQNKAS